MDDLPVRDAASTRPVAPPGPGLVCHLFGHDPTLADPGRCYCGAPVDEPAPTTVEV